MTKVCTRCGESMPLDAFAVDRSKRTGRKARCKSCDRERARRWYAENAAEHVARQLAARAARKSKPTRGAS